MNVASESITIKELTIRGIVLAILLTVLLAMSNAFLALKLGILTSASIPAAIISMGILRFFKGSTLLENNAVQTAASAGEAVAGGIVYTIPALIIIHYWYHFDYITNFLIALLGGVLGVLFSIPLRRILVHDPVLKFPEGRAIAEVLKTSSVNVGIRYIVIGGAVGAILEFLQMALKLIASDWSFWFPIKRVLLGFGMGFSATMIGAGYLIGPEMAISIFLGAVISWIIALPIASHYYPQFIDHYSAQDAVIVLWNNEMRYLGIGAMLFAGIWTFLKLIKPLANTISTSLVDVSNKTRKKQTVIRTEQDISFPYILAGITFIAAVLFFFLQYHFPLSSLGLNPVYIPTWVLGAVFYIVIIGFLFSVITAYFSGMVGVSASPGSSVVIAGMLLAAWLLLTAMQHFLPLPLEEEQIRAAEAITIIIGSIVTGIAAIANDNTQDLKVGHLVGATPWRQQLMLLLGVFVSALVIPPVMQILFNVYGIAGVMPRPNMDMSQSLPAPTAVLMAAITEAVFRNTLPWKMMFSGVSIIIALLVLTRLWRLNRFIRLSVLGVAIGMYLPLSSSLPLFIGGMVSWIAQKRLQRLQLSKEESHAHQQTGILIACGLVAGSTLMDVFLAIPFSILESPEALKIVGSYWAPYAIALGFLSIGVLSWWIVRAVSQTSSQ